MTEINPIVFTFGYFVYLYWFAWAMVGLLGGVWIFRDAKKLPELFLDSKPIWWALATVMLGAIWVILVYWLIHHSSISNRLQNKTVEKS